MHTRRREPGSPQLKIPNAVEGRGDISRLAALEPLLRKPKTLVTAPDLFLPHGTVRAKRDDRYDEADPEKKLQGTGSTLLTRHRSQQRSLIDLLEDEYVDPEAASKAHDLASRLVLKRRQVSRRRSRVPGRMATVPFSGGSDEIDLDRTLDSLAQRRPLLEEDIYVREQRGSKRATMLVVDVSGSMRGEKMQMTAAAVGALSADFNQSYEELGVVAFWSEAAVLKPLSNWVGPGVVLDRLLRIPTRGLTNIEFALTVAHDELDRSSALRRTAIILTDAMHNAGGDPRLVAARFPRLHVLLETDGEHDGSLGRDLAGLGHGRLARVPSYRDVGPALSQLLDEG